MLLLLSESQNIYKLSVVSILTTGGPRPLSTLYLPYYTKEEMRRHDVRPGLTGWAQVHGRNSASWKKRFEYDIYYVDHCSFLLDVKTIIQTVAVVLKHEDIGQGNERPVAFNIERQNEWDENGISDSRDKSKLTW